MVRQRRSVTCGGVGSWSRGRGNGGVVGRLGRQGTGLCRLLWGVEETGKRSLETRFRLLGLWGQRKRRCVLVEWLHGLRDGHALEYCIGRISYKGFLCPLSEIPGFPLRVVCLSVGWAFLFGLSVCRLGLPLRVVCLSVGWAFLFGLSVCLSVGPSSSGCLSVCRLGLPLRVIYLCVCCVGLPLRARCCGRVGGPSCSWALVSGLVTMSSIAINRTG